MQASMSMCSMSGWCVMLLFAVVILAIVAQGVSKPREDEDKGEHDKDD